ncbi:YncE family protein [Piscibacillus salipiscarius]|nr:hypothetical protein [Piscibacillus salipiscarius]
MPSNITHVLSDGQLRLMYDSQNKTIFNNQDNYADQTAQTQFNNNKLSLNQPIDKWVFDEPNQKIYAISTSENQLLVINAGTMEVIESRFVGSAPTDIELLNNKLYIALAGSTKIATTSTAQGSAVNYITTLQNPYDLTTDGTKINYATLDQHVTLYHIDLQTNTEQALEFYDTNKNTYYEPAIHLDSSNNYLYVGESGSTGSDLLVLNPETGEHISVYEFSFSLPERAILMENNDLYYAGHRFDKTNITNSKVQLFENRDKLIAISDSYIFSDRKIYNKETNQPIFEYPSDMTVNSAAADSSGNIYLSTSENNAIYKFKSLDELQNRIVQKLAFTQHDNGSYEFTWDQVTGDGYKIYAKHEELDKFTSITDAPVIAQNLKVTNAQLKQWLGRDVSFELKLNSVTKNRCR